MRTSSAIVRHAGALLAVGSAALHGAALGPGVTPWLAALTVLMLVGCLYCAYELLTRDTVRAWVLVAVMNLAMVAVHLPMTGTHHHGARPGVSAAVPTAMELATVVALIEILLAAAVLFVRTRALAPDVVAPCQSGRHDAGGNTGRPVGCDVDRLPESR